MVYECRLVGSRQAIKLHVQNLLPASDDVERLNTEDVEGKVEIQVEIQMEPDRMTRIIGSQRYRQINATLWGLDNVKQFMQFYVVISQNHGASMH